MEAHASRTEIVGREHELAALHAFAAGERLERTLVLSGTPGIGKTTLWDAGVNATRINGCRVLTARPSEREAKLSLAGLADLLDPVTIDEIGHLPRPQSRALEVALLRAEPDGRPPETRTLGTALRSLLRELSMSTPVLVAIDDAHWLDPATAQALDFASRRLDTAEVRILLAKRSGMSSPFLDSLERDRSEQIQVGPLSFGAIRRLLLDRLGVTMPLITLRRIVAETGGNPLFALEIARAIRDVHSLGPRDPLPLPEDLLELVSGRIAQTAPRPRRALLAAATLARPTRDLVEKASSAAGLAAAENAGLVRVNGDRVVFTHPLYASSVYASASEASRRRMHACLATLVPNREERARHLALAASRPTESVARTLEEAAELARSRGAWISAAELLELARALTPRARPRDARRRALRAAEHHAHAGDRTRARALLEELLVEVRSGTLRGDALRILGEVSFNDGNREEAERLFTEALLYIEESRSFAEVECALTYLRSVALDFAGAGEHAQLALEHAERSDDGPVHAEALSVCALVDYMRGLGLDWTKVELARALEDPERVAPIQWRPSVIEALLLLYTDRLDEARERLVAVRDEAVARGDESDLAFLLTWLSWLETRAGNFAAAAAIADEGVAVARLTGSASQYAHVLAQRAWVDAHLGDVEATRRGGAEAAAATERAGWAVPGLWVAAALGLLELSLGNADAAWASCEGPTVAFEHLGINAPGPVFFLPSALEALVAIGDLQRAEPLIDALAACGDRLDDAWARATSGRCRALVLAARGDLVAAADVLELALAEHERLPMPFERARTQLVAGIVERRVRRWARARALLEEAAGEFERMDARLWGERARSELARVGGRRASGEGLLTPSQERVAALAAQGLSNKEIAQALSVTVHTVEAHLKHAYSKLGIRSRAHLTRHLTLVA